MNETIVKRLRSGMTGMTVLSAVVALLGAIAIFVVTGILENQRHMSSDEAMAASIVLMVAWDILRMGCFGMFACALISVIFELFGKASGKMYSFIMLFGSVFGLISGFILSFESILKKTQDYDLDDIGQNFFILPCIFGIVSAVIVFVGLGMRSYQPAPLAYLPQGYPQQYPQGYPQQYPQGYPQQYPQGYPQQYPQGYPQQSVPAQPVDPNDPGNAQ